MKNIHDEIREQRAQWRRERESRQRAKRWLALFVLVWVAAGLGFMLVLTGCDPATTNVGEDAVEPGATPDLEILSFDWGETSFGSRAIVGTIKNNTDREWAYASVQFELLDEDRNTVGSALDNVSHLGAGGTWKFSALVLEDSAAIARVADITAW